MTEGLGYEPPDDASTTDTGPLNRAEAINYLVRAGVDYRLVDMALTEAATCGKTGKPVPAGPHQVLFLHNTGRWYIESPAQPRVVQYLACPECGTEQLGPSLTGCGHPYHQAGDGVVLHWDEHGQQTGLTQQAALTRLKQLGVSDLASVQAIEMAPQAGDGIVFTSWGQDGVMVSFAEGYGWAVTPRNQAAEPADVYDLTWVLRVVEIVDRHLDEAAPPLYRVTEGDSPETAAVKKVLNRWRRLAAGPASEGQESVDQLNLLTGGNPRKGIVGTEDDVLLELGDTVGAALFAIQSITKDTQLTWQWVLAALSKALGRVPPAEVAVILTSPEVPEFHPGLRQALYETLEETGPPPGQDDDDDLPPVMVPGDV